MKGSCPNVLCPIADLSFQPFLDLSCRFIGKGNGQNIVRSNGVCGKSEQNGKNRFFSVKRGIFCDTAKHSNFLGGNAASKFCVVSRSEMDQIGNAVDQYRSFSASRTGNDKSWPGGGENRFLLLIIQKRVVKFKQLFLDILNRIHLFNSKIDPYHCNAKRKKSKGGIEKPRKNLQICA